MSVFISNSGIKFMHKTNIKLLEDLISTPEALKKLQF